MNRSIFFFTKQLFIFVQNFNIWYLALNMYVLCFFSFLSISVQFSPQQTQLAYLQTLIQKIGGAKEKLDISIYHFKQAELDLALARAIKRGVKIRMVYEEAVKDRKEKGDTHAHDLEKLDVEVKYLRVLTIAKL